MYYICITYIYIYIYSLLKFLQQNFKNTVQQNTPEALCESDVDPKKVLRIIRNVGVTKSYQNQ